MEEKLELFVKIMVFYAVLAYLVCPLVAFKFVEPTLNSAGNGFVVGSLISVGLWYTYGKKMLNQSK